MSTQPNPPVANRPGSFYLGCEYDLQDRTPLPRPDHEVHYDSKDLCTHGVVVGMTGSGKTGLSLALLEEAALDNVPCIMVDPKGDLTNLLLQFPTLDPQDFARWINPDEAAQKGVTVEQLAEQLAARWREGLAASGYGPERIAELKAKSEYRVYTPGSTAGLPLAILDKFTAPDPRIPEEDRNQKIDATASALLGLTGVSSDPLQSREHILIANLLAHAWNKGRDLDLRQLIHQILDPPVREIGALDVDVFYKEKDRAKLANSLNNILASPSFSTWLRGEALDLSQLLAGSGRTRQLIFSVAHLDDSQRMFFITLLLSEVLNWTRKQTGTTTLRALLYFDEVAGYLPPHPGNPTSKKPLMTLFKQARAFGVGVLLATQNPVDVDYKALSNAGTWFVGKLQTERDKARLMDGLEGAAAERGAGSNRAALEKKISNLGNRLFLMHNVHRGGEPKVFQTRWALSFLRGPMSREEISRLMEPLKQGQPAPATAPPPAPASAPTPPPAPAPAPAPVAPRQQEAGTIQFQGVTRNVSTVPLILAPDFPQFFLAPSTPAPAGAALVYVAQALGNGEVVCTDKKMGRPFKRTACLLAPAPAEGQAIDWTTATPVTPTLEPRARPDALWSDLPDALNSARKIKELEKGFVAFLTASKLKVPRNPALNMLSEADEGREAFLNRCLAVAWREFEKAMANDSATYAGEFTRYGATLPTPALPDAGLPWPERWAALSAAVAALRAAPSASLDAKKQKQLQELEGEWRSLLAGLVQNWQSNAEHIEELSLTPTAKDVRLVQFGLAWTPLWRGTSGEAVRA